MVRIQSVAPTEILLKRSTDRMLPTIHLHDELPRQKRPNSWILPRNHRKSLWQTQNHTIVDGPQDSRRGAGGTQSEVIDNLHHCRLIIQRAPNTPEFAQPRLSRVKGRSSLARGYKFGCVCSYMAGHYPGILMTGHIGTNTPKFVTPRRGRRPLTLLNQLQ